MNSQKLLEVLRLGILEIRTLANEREDNRRRINVLANLLHNIPDAILDDSRFDYNLLKKEIKKYENNYGKIFDYLSILEK